MILVKSSTTEAALPHPLLRRVPHISGWALLIGIIVLVVSGWGITNTGIIYQLSFGLIDRKLANTIHRAVNAPLSFFFLLHVLVNIKLAISARYAAGAWLNALLIASGIILFVLVLFMEYFS